MKRVALLLALSLLCPLAGAAEEPSALREMRDAASHGDAAAQFEMGILYEFGFNMPNNKAPAFAWYSLAADQGHERAAMRRDQLRGQMTAQETDEAQRLKATLVQRPATETK